jgi:hypothetical protein
MRFLNTRRVLSNMKLTALCLNGVPASTLRLKSDFIRALNRSQSMLLESVPNDLYLEFDNPGLVNRLIERTVFSPLEVMDDVHLVQGNDRDELTNLLNEARTLLSSELPDLYFLMTQVVATVALYRIPRRDGGSVSSNIGLIWLSPKPDWTVEYCAEMLVHEFVHNVVFLEDMVRGIMPTPELLERDEALSISAIRQTRRPYDKSFHSACVTVGIMYFYNMIGRTRDANKHFEPLKRTVEELCASEQRLRSLGQELLTNNGREILEELSRFTREPDYLAITDTLRLQSQKTLIDAAAHGKRRAELTFAAP